MGPERVDLLRERPVGGEQRLYAHGAGHVGGAQHACEVFDRQAGHGKHAFGPVDERQSFLRLERDRLEPGRAERLR